MNLPRITMLAALVLTGCTAVTGQKFPSPTTPVNAADFSVRIETAPVSSRATGADVHMWGFGDDYVRAMSLKVDDQVIQFPSAACNDLRDLIPENAELARSAHGYVLQLLGGDG